MQASTSERRGPTAFTCAKQSFSSSCFVHLQFNPPSRKQSAITCAEHRVSALGPNGLKFEKKLAEDPGLETTRVDGVEAPQRPRRRAAPCPLFRRTRPSLSPAGAGARVPPVHALRVTEVVAPHVHRGDGLPVTKTDGLNGRTELFVLAGLLHRRFVDRAAAFDVPLVCAGWGAW